MNSQEVVSKVRFYNDARRSIREDRNLSTQGKERAGKNLEQSISLFRSEALQALEKSWRDARRLYNHVEELRRKAEKAEGERWNYDALNYESQAVRSRLSGFHGVQEVAHFVEGVLSSGNKEKARATAELAPGVLRERFPGVEGERLSRELTRRLERMVDTPELAQVRQLEDEGGRQVLQLLRDTEEVANFFGSGNLIMGGSGNEFHQLLNNVSVTRKITPENMYAFETTTIVFNQAEGAPAGA